MYNLFHKQGEVKFLVTELDIDYYVKQLEVEKEEILRKISEMSESGSNKGKKREETSKAEALDKRIEEALELKEKFGNNPLMAGAMFMLYGDEIIYLFSGTKSEFMTLKSQYLLQWDIMQYGIDHGYKLHNFYGINGSINKDDDRYGVYLFKRSFSGTVIEYIGDFDLVTDKFKYNVHKFIDKIKK